ncbi:MAG TPA: Ni/Fe-hydrogenase, b-type cytochrome subunit [Nitrospirae bacterium]|nr:putative Ni/Fe-hydrogenase B-type cytochrome subunit [bacterium BMS3Abin10]GBE39620.1 putative Ni/Fe-hydrogenase B-type cytochrome subunit [bacterium BMS3Bbin08]HDH50258.1 Ni/Fe-hydrogenase, b-type cytochrome subunit [Nitrospirota bacterium]HDK81297.1 Ni/Fe-hydrogenase, b-type cytochrome subunit [Nitrospirota bacterium]
MEEQRTRKYVWEFPVRLTHWINALSILALSFTGLYIGMPFIHATSPDQYIMGWMRLVHFIAAYTFMMSIIIRSYWSLMGNRYASFKIFFPFSIRKLGDMLEELKFYLLISRKPPSITGHTALGGLTMLIVWVIFIFEIISGFALYSVTHSGAVWTILGGWLVGIMYLPTIRLYHHLLMYVILAFTLVHIYIVWYSTSSEKNGLMASILSGYKFVTGKEQDI